MTTVDTVTMDAGDRNVFTFKGGGGIRRRMPVGDRILKITSVQGHGNSLSGTYDGIYHMTLKFAEPHGASVGDFLTTSCYTNAQAEATNIRNMLHVGPTSISTSRSPWHKVVNVPDSTTLICTCGLNVTQAEVVITDGTSYTDIGAYAYFLGYKVMRIAVRIMIEPDFTDNFRLHYQTDGGVQTGRGIYLGWSSGPFSQLSQKVRVFSGADFGYNMLRYYASSSEYYNVSGYQSKVNPYCSGWGYTSNSNITALFPVWFTQYGTYLQSLRSFDHESTDWYNAYVNKTSIIPVFNPQDKGLVLMIETGITDKDNASRTTFDQYWRAWQSCHLHPAVDDGAAVPTGITAARFRQLLELADLTTVPDEMLYTAFESEGNYDSTGDTNTIRPWAGPVYNEEVGNWHGCGKDWPMDHLEFSWYNTWNRCRLLDYGWAKIA